MSNKDKAKEIVGAWGYEEAYWWEPIQQALEQKDKEKMKIIKVVGKYYVAGHSVVNGILDSIIEEQKSLINK